MAGATRRRSFEFTKDPSPDIFLIVACFWSLRGDQPFYVAPFQAAVAPLILLCLIAWPDKYCLGVGRGRERRQSLISTLLFAGIGIAIGAWREFPDLVLDNHAWRLAVGAVVLSIAFSLLAAWIDQRPITDLLSLVPSFVGVLTLSLGTMVQANGHLAPKLLHQTHVEVVDTSMWHSRGRSTYEVHLQQKPGAPIAKVTVFKSIFDQLSVGDHICYLHNSGVLGLTWWELGSCQ